jgi:hypothetical protein
MSKEASWVAAVLAGLLLLMALFAPAQGRGDLPTLDDAESPREDSVIGHVPLVGPILEYVQRQLVLATWRLENAPIE